MMCCEVPGNFSFVASKLFLGGGPSHAPQTLTTFGCRFWLVAGSFIIWRDSKQDRFFHINLLIGTLKSLEKKSWPATARGIRRQLLLARRLPKTMKKRWVFLIFSSKHMVLLRKIGVFKVLRAIGDHGWPHTFRAAKKIIEKPWVFELLFWQPSLWPAKPSS